MMNSYTKSYQKLWPTIWTLCLMTIFLLWANNAVAGELAGRIANFPNWENKPSISTAKAQLIYPKWMSKIGMLKAL